MPAASEATGVWLQPFLYELPRPFGGLPRGALLFAGNSLGNFTSTEIVLYASTRPGMATVAQVHHSLWIMTHEAGGDSGDNFYAVHYKLARDPESFGLTAEHVLHDQNGYIPSAAPTVSWSDSGGRTGTIIVSANSDQDFFINSALGDPDKWTRQSSAMPAGYSRYTIPLASPGSWRRPGLVFVVTGPTYGNNGPIQAGVIRLD